jgi:plasmid stability protein
MARYLDTILPMAQVVVRQLDDDVKEKLQRRARRHGRSTEEEIREILRDAVRSEGTIRTPLGSRIAARFRRLGLDAEIPELRDQSARPAKFRDPR